MNQEIAGYSLSRKLAGGGATRLFVALDSQQERYIVRTLDPASAKNRLLRKQFFRGGEILAALQSPQPHPNIVPFVKAGVEGKTPYMVLRYVESRTLRDLLLYRDPLLTENVLVFVRQLANVIRYIHSRGFLHLDVKPENILIRPDGVLVLIDFDLALPIKRFFKRIPVPPGHPSHLPPQTLTRRLADERADIYSFGVCCYEMLTFHKPYEAEKIEQVQAAQIDPKTPPTPIRQWNENIPVALANLVMKCIAKDPAERYPDMVLVLRDLDRLNNPN